MPAHPPPLRISIHPSRAFAGWLAFAHVGAALCLVSLAMPPAMDGVVGAALLTSLMHSVWRHALRRHPESVVGLGHSPGAGWWLTKGSGEQLPARLIADAFVHPALIVLRFDSSGRGGYSVVLLADAVRPDDARALRVRLRVMRSR